jgi:hypothetical protein
MRFTLSMLVIALQGMRGVSIGDEHNNVEQCDFTGYMNSMERSS